MSLSKSYSKRWKLINFQLFEWYLRLGMIDSTSKCIFYKHDGFLTTVLRRIKRVFEQLINLGLSDVCKWSCMRSYMNKEMFDFDFKNNGALIYHQLVSNTIVNSNTSSNVLFASLTLPNLVCRTSVLLSKVITIYQLQCYVNMLMLFQTSNIPYILLSNKC